MNILFFVKTNQNLHNIKLLGGIEILNYNLYNFFKKKNLTILTNKITNKIKDINWDVVISSNDATIFNYIKTKRKILWLHNKLQIEKSIRKKQFFSLIKHKIEAVFVSKYLDKNTSSIYNFTKRIVIPNFLPSEFKDIKINNLIRKKNFIWSVQREKGIHDLLRVWINKIHISYPEAKLHIFGINNLKFNKLKNFNIYYHGHVPRRRLIKYYKESTAMICLGYDETFCLNAIEAMACGLPIISFGKTALKEIIRNNQNGFIINSYNDLNKIVDKIINLNSLKRKKLIYQSKKFSEIYQMRNVIKHWNNLLFYQKKLM